MTLNLLSLDQSRMRLDSYYTIIAMTHIQLEAPSVKMVTRAPSRLSCNTEIVETIHHPQPQEYYLVQHVH
jgi:hypothetical protein